MRKKRKPLFVITAIVGCVLLLSLFFYLHSCVVHSDSQMLKKQLRRTAKDVMKRDYAALEGIMSADYDGSIGSSPQEAISIARNVLENVEDLSIKIRSTDITLDENNEAHLHCNFEYSGYYVGAEIYNRIPLSGGLPAAVPGEARLRFKKEGGNWRIIHVELALGEQSHR